jgi:uncharacterized protein YoxC
MSTSSVILIAILSLFVGVTIPVLIQFRATLRELEQRLRTTGGRLDRVLEDSEIVAQRIAHLTEGFDGKEHAVGELLTSVSELSKAMTRVSGWMGIASSVGAVVGPAVTSAVRAYRSSRWEESEEEGTQQEASSDKESTVGRPDRPASPSPAVPIWRPTSPSTGSGDLHGTTGFVGEPAMVASQEEQTIKQRERSTV